MNEIITCDSCGKKVTPSQLRADKTGKSWICLDCYKKQHNIVSKPREPMYEGVELKRKEPGEKKKYICQACNYKFESAIFKEGKICPYCGKSGAVTKIIPTAQIIQESSAMEFN